MCCAVERLIVLTAHGDDGGVGVDFVRDVGLLCPMAAAMVVIRAPPLSIHMANP